MVLYYTTKNKERLVVSAQNLLSLNCEKAEVCCLYENGIGRTAKKQIITEQDGGRYFVWNGERVYIGNYETLKVDDLVKELSNSEAKIHPVVIYATIMKFSDDIAFLLNPLPYAAVKETDEVFQMVYPSKMLFVPTDRNNPKDNWDKVITLTPNNKEYWKFFSDIALSFDAFLEMLKNDTIKIVNRRKFIAEHTATMEHYNNLSRFQKKRYEKKNGVPPKVML